MKKRGFTIFTITVLLIAVVGLIMYQKNTNNVFSVENTTENSEPISITEYSFTETYNHPTLSLSFKYPAGFTVKSTNLSSGPGGGELLVVENKDAVGFQIRVEEMDEDIAVITPEMIKADLPDILLEDPQEVVLGQMVEVQLSSVMTQLLTAGVGRCGLRLTDIFIR